MVMHMLHAWDMDMQHGHGNAAKTWACSMDMDMQHGYKHAAWTWPISTSMDMLQGNHRNIVALFLAFMVFSLLLLQSFLHTSCS
jgi:hypothetical protein